MNYRIFRLGTREPVYELELHVLAKAYYAAWLSVRGSAPVREHIMPRLDLLMDFGPMTPSVHGKSPARDCYHGCGYKNIPAAKDATMAQQLPYDVTTATGEKIAFEFPLHAETQSAMRVSQLLTAVLGVVDRELRVLGNTANGDVMQALAMALAARTAMLHAPYAVGRQLASDLVATALAAAEHCERDDGGAGHA